MSSGISTETKPTQGTLVIVIGNHGQPLKSSDDSSRHDASEWRLHRPRKDLVFTGAYSPHLTRGPGLANYWTIPTAVGSTRKFSADRGSILARSCGEPG